ncbi:MAG: hypothetical protein IJH32_06355 [Ruminococcus sp.]|nr:hypothetical protein [Ruminococcus sp.]
MKKLSNSEKNFCRLYAVSGDADFAAREAGLKDPKRAQALLFKDEVIDETVRILRKQREMLLLLCENAMMRIVTAPASDALRLAHGEIAFRDRAELRGVSEYKCTDKGSEVRFFDKVKAFEKLCDLIEIERDSPGSDLLSALSLGAKALSKIGDDTGEV